MIFNKGGYEKLNDFDRLYADMSVLVSGRQHYDCQIERIDAEVLHVLKELSELDKWADNYKYERGIRIKLINQLGQKRMEDVKKRSGLGISNVVVV